MIFWAQSYLDLHKNVEKDYTGKYEQYKINIITTQKTDEEISTTAEDSSIITVSEVPIEETDIFKELKAYRLDKSRDRKNKTLLHL